MSDNYMTGDMAGSLIDDDDATDWRDDRLADQQATIARLQRQIATHEGVQRDAQRRYQQQHTLMTKQRQAIEAERDKLKAELDTIKRAWGVACREDAKAIQALRREKEAAELRAKALEARNREAQA